MNPLLLNYLLSNFNLIKLNILIYPIIFSNMQVCIKEKSIILLKYFCSRIQWLNPLTIQDIRYRRC